MTLAPRGGRWKQEMLLLMFRRGRSGLWWTLASRRGISTRGRGKRTAWGSGWRGEIWDLFEKQQERGKLFVAVFLGRSSPRGKKGFMIGVALDWSEVAEGVWLSLGSLGFSFFSCVHFCRAIMGMFPSVATYYRR